MEVTLATSRESGRRRYSGNKADTVRGGLKRIACDKKRMPHGFHGFLTLSFLCFQVFTGAIEIARAKCVPADVSNAGRHARFFSFFHARCRAGKPDLTKGLATLSGGAFRTACGGSSPGGQLCGSRRLRSLRALARLHRMAKIN